MNPFSFKERKRTAELADISKERYRQDRNTAKLGSISRHQFQGRGLEKNQEEIRTHSSEFERVAGDFKLAE